MRFQLMPVAFTAAAVLAAFPLVAAEKPAAKTNHEPAKTEAVRSVWPAESLTGTISMVDPNDRRVVVQTPDGVPFDMVVTRGTRIESGNGAVSLQELNQDKDKSVSVRFVPERRGDVAKVIRITG